MTRTRTLPTPPAWRDTVTLTGKYPPSVVRRWNQILARPLVALSSHGPWVVAEKLDAEFGINLEIKLVRYTWGADSTRSYRARFVRR